MADTELLQAEADLQRDVMFVELHRHIATLKAEYQDVLTLRFFEDKTVPQIAQILGKREGTVKSWLHRAIKQLREKMIG